NKKLSKKNKKMIKANNPQLKSWLDIPADTDFPIQNLPFGIYQKEGQAPRVCSALGDNIIDLFRLSELGLFADLEIPKAVLENQYLNDFISLGKKTSSAVRERLSDLFDEGVTKWNSREMADHVLIPMSDVKLLLPVKVGDYTDFYSSIEHATNVGIMFRDPANALMPNWRHIPVGYHGRASSIVVSGTPIHRPSGQQMPKGAEAPVYGPCRLLDFELEVAFVIGKATELGDSVKIENAEDHIFGLALFNDWSARDIQKWEYVPLGPFLGKSFASTVSPWIVTMEALEPFRIAGPEQVPAVFPYLQYEGQKNYDVNLEVKITTEGGASKTVSESNFKYMYWNMCQQLAHHTVNGCNINVGDMCASGTISGKTPDSYGSMLEISWQGTKSVAMPDGTERKFIQDGDTVSMHGFSAANGVRIGFGEATGKVLPAK
ncbi:MAG: fumarylacetoacetase, partial [Gammaproteobacteria bacterium]